MPDSSDSVILTNFATDPFFQRRVRLRFIVAAIAVTTEEVQIAASQATGSGASILHFASVPSAISGGLSVTNVSNNGTVPISATVSGTGAGTVTLSTNVIGAGVAVNDVISFGPAPSASGNPVANPHTLHLQRLAFAGALLADSASVFLEMLCMLVLANTTCRTKLLAAPNIQGGGNIQDIDLDNAISQVLTGVATSRSW